MYSSAQLLNPVGKLAKFLMDPGVSISDVTKFLVLDTFAEFKPSAAHIHVVTEDGHLLAEGQFGLSKETVNSWQNIPLTSDTPLADAVKTNKVIKLKQSETHERYPVFHDDEGITQQWETYLITPIIPHGVFALTLHASPELDEDFEIFLRTVGTLIMLHYVKQEVKIESFELKGSTKQRKKIGALTERQLLIRHLIERGFTNAGIAAEIGYSESLVRHETMEIYAILQVSGRQELVQNSKGA